MPPCKRRKGNDSMGTSTDGQLSFGIVFEEGFEFPWNDEDFDGEIDDWWRSVNGYTNPHPDPFTEGGAYKPEFNRDSTEVRTYFNHQFDWDKQNPFPIEVVNYCHIDYPMYLLAVKHIECSRRYPREIDPAFLEVGAEDRMRLTRFLLDYGIETNNEPKWWLTSYWG